MRRNDSEGLTYGQLLAEGKKTLAAFPEAATDSFLLLEHVTGLNRAQYFLKAQDTARQEEITAYRGLLAQRKKHVPLQHLTGVQEFMGLLFKVNGDVLVPRQDTECLVELALPYVKGRRVLDMCTGSGCIAVSLMALGGALSCDAADLSREALLVAEYNAVQNHTAVTFLWSDLFENVTGTYDVIVSNPPYIETAVIETLDSQVREYEPRMALDGGADGLKFYRRILRECQGYLKNGGWLFLEIGYCQAAAVVQLFREARFGDISVKKDYAGHDRVVSGRKMEGD